MNDRPQLDDTNYLARVQGYERAMERMARGEMTLQEALERVQLALTFALANERGHGPSRLTLLHTRHATACLEWVTDRTVSL